MTPCIFFPWVAAAAAAAAEICGSVAAGNNLDFSDISVASLHVLNILECFVTTFVDFLNVLECFLDVLRLLGKCIV